MKSRIIIYSYLSTTLIPFLLLEYSYGQTDPIHVCLIYQSKPVHFQFSEITNVYMLHSQIIYHQSQKNLQKNEKFYLQVVKAFLKRRKCLRLLYHLSNSNIKEEKRKMCPLIQKRRKKIFTL